MSQLYDGCIEKEETIEHLINDLLPLLATCVGTCVGCNPILLMPTQAVIGQALFMLGDSVELTSC